MTDTRIVYGFLDAGKTAYIQDCILNDYFYKRGTTLILCFEQGEAEYDTEKLREKKAQAVFYDGRDDITGFCTEMMETYHPDRIYVEMNAMMDGLREKLPETMQVTFAVTLIDWSTMEPYFVNFRQMISSMTADSQQVIFRGCPSKELLAPYSQAFRLMNRRASYLRQDPMGYHEKAFDLFVPFSLEEEEITISAAEYLPFWLDAADHPEHYDGKKLNFTDPLELRRLTETDSWTTGRVVMTCCMADLQFMSFELISTGIADGGWIIFEALGEAGTAEYGRKTLKLKPLQIRYAPPPEQFILSASLQS